ncbi:MAG: hypothetical protein ACIAS6_12250 [Phycisphaerales bacterium JB060]
MTTRDVDALFEHMTTNQGHDMADEKEWVFSMLHPDTALLERVGTPLADEFDVDLVTCELCDDQGNTTGERVDLLISMIAALKPDEVKALSARFEALANEHGVEYEGVACTDPLPEDFFDWMELEDAQWRLKHLADSGWPEGEAIPFLFAIECDDAQQAKKLGAAFDADGLDGKLDDVEIIDDPEQGTGVAVQMDGVHDEAVLATAYAMVEAIAKEHGATLLGVQFFGDDEDGEGDGEG